MLYPVTVNQSAGHTPGRAASPATLTCNLVFLPLASFSGTLNVFIHAASPLFTGFQYFSHLQLIAASSFPAHYSLISLATQFLSSHTTLCNNKIILRIHNFHLQLATFNLHKDSIQCRLINVNKDLSSGGASGNPASCQAACGRLFLKLRRPRVPEELMVFKSKSRRSEQISQDYRALHKGFRYHGTFRCRLSRSFHGSPVFSLRAPCCECLLQSLVCLL